jgi:hypothetical protein
MTALVQQPVVNPAAGGTLPTELLGIKQTWLNNCYPNKSQAKIQDNILSFNYFAIGLSFRYNSSS